MSMMFVQGSENTASRLSVSSVNMIAAEDKIKRAERYASSGADLATTRAKLRPESPRCVSLCARPPSSTTCQVFDMTPC